MISNAVQYVAVLIHSARAPSDWPSFVGQGLSVRVLLVLHELQVSTNRKSSRTFLSIKPMSLTNKI